MTPITTPDALTTALDGILNNRLVLIAGAGLSMAAPSNLPSAAKIAADAKAEYDSRYGGIKPPLPAGMEDQAEMFFQAKELGIYLKEFVDQDAFAAQPNAGHVAVADLLLSHGLQAAVSTNVYILIETAGQSLMGHVFTGIEGTAVAAAPSGTAPMRSLPLVGILRRGGDGRASISTRRRPPAGAAFGIKGGVRGRLPSPYSLTSQMRTRTPTTKLRPTLS